MTLNIQLSGVYTALVTPFTVGGGLDETSLRRLVRLQIAGGVTGLVSCGTTGEGSTLTLEEFDRVVAIVVEETKSAGRKIQVIPGTGSNDTRRSIELSRRAKAAGADAALVVTPYYNKPTQPGLIAHYRAMAEAGGLPVVIYNVPSRTGVNLLPETALQLAEDPRFIAIKEASGNLDQAAEILRGRPAGFAVLSGEDSLTAPMIALGADGVIAVISNEAPALWVELVNAALAGERAKVSALHARLLPLMKANFRESNPIPVKWALARMGLIENVLRLPLLPLTKSHHAALEAALQSAGLLPAAAAWRAS
jgi:4-hydroxy-tetrahydrodipicolinate synthase